MAVAILGTHDLAHADVPRAPILWALEEGQTRIRLQWNSRGDEVIDHKIEVCAELDAGDCDDWTVLVADHPQEPSSTRSNMYKHEGLPAGSTRHYRVSSRNDDGFGDPSTVRSATTNSMVLVPECAAAFWSAEVTVARGLVFDKRGYMSPSFGSISDSGFSRRAATYTVTQLYFNQTSRFAEKNYGWTPDYHFAITTALPESRLGDFVLYVGEVTLPFGSVSAHSTQTYGESYRWGSAAYKDTFDYVAGDRVTVCLTDAAPIVTFVLTPDSISENGDSSTVTATIEQASEDPFTVTVSAEPVSPAGTGDFMLSTNKVLTFAANATDSTGAVTITAKDNNVDAPDKTVTVKGEMSSGARPTAPDDVTLTITDDDPEPALSLSVDPDEISEARGESTVTVRTGDTTFADDQTITLKFESESTATETDDYTVSSKSLTLGATQTAVTATVTAEEDLVYEGDETILVTASRDGNPIGSQQRITIDENESEPELSISDGKASEGEAVSFVVELSGAVSSEVKVSYATSDDGTGTNPAAGTDYTAVSATELTFRPGEALRQTVSVATAEDELNEADETFKLTITAPDPEVAGVILGDAEAVGTITDDDELTVSVAGPGANVEEGQTATFTVTVTGTSTTAVVVSYEVDTDASTATATDYTAPSETELTISAGVASGTIQIVTNTDTVLEPDETLVLKLTAASTAGAVSVATATAEATIEDPGTVTVSVGDAQASEGDSVQFEVELSGAVSSEVKVSYATSDDTGATAAVAGTDYTAVSAATLTFTAGDTVKTVSVATAEDDLNEADETFTVALSGVTLPAGVSLGDAEAVGTITDDDELTVSVAGPGANVEEGQTATFTVTVTGTSTTAVVVSYEVDTDASTATATDYTAPSGTELTIGAGVASGTIEVVTNTDAVLEPHETLVLKLTAASTAGEVGVSTTAATAAATIEDKGTVTVSVRDAQASEGESVQFVVELTGAVSSEVKVSYATSDGTGANPAAGTDYTAVSATELTFRPGEALRQTVSVATAEDELNEADETFKLTITAPDPEVAGVILGDAEAVGTITDDDELTVSVAGPGANVEEGQTATFTVTVTGTSTTAVVVSYEVDTDASTATATDYTAPSETELTISAGVASGTIQIVTNTDTVLEPDETLVLKLTAASTAGAVSVATATAEATIEDPGTVTVSVGDAQASEGDSVQFEVELSGAVSSEVKVSYATSDDTGATAAVAGTDYTAVSAATLTFTAGDTVKTVSVATAEDDLNEADETFTVALSGVTLPAGVSLGDAEAVGTITDDDELTVSVAGPGANVEEGQTATFTVTVTGTSTTAVVVSYEVDTDASTATATDYTAPSGTELTIGAGVASGTIEVVTNTDAVLEPHETLVLKLTAASTAGEVGVSTTAATAAATIEDKGTVTVSVRDAQASEGESVQFVVELTGAVSSEVKVSYATSDGTGANPAAGTDYTAVSATELTFRPGEALRQTVSVATAEDELNEADETFTVALSGVTLPAGVSLGDAEAVGTITDDDELTVSVAGPGANVEEGQTATFTVTVTGTSTTAVVVSYEVDTDASTATATDYTAPSETELTISAGVASGTIQIVTNTDTVLEPDETLVLKLTAASTAGAVSVATATAEATIEDPGTVTVSVGDAQASEGDSVQFEVELSGAVSSEVKVSYATSDDTGATAAVAGTDYTAVSATELTFRPGEALRQTVSVATAEDELNEADETFKLTITAPDPEVAGVILGDAEAVGTITDDDELTVSVAGPGANVEEGQTATFTVTVTGTSTTAVVVSYEVDTDASTATATDYTAPSETELTISAGVASGTIQIVTNTDTVLEPDETLVLKLTAASTAGAVSVATATAEATIEDPGTVTVSVGDAQASEGDSVQFEVELSGAVSSEVKVSYATSDDTGATAAVAGTDYTAVSATTLTFMAGDTVKTVTVATAEDELNEADETFTLTITAPDPEVAGVSLGDAEAVGTITDDDELTVSVAGPGANVEEGQTATFTVTVTGTSTTAVVVSYEVDTDASTATATDYTAPSGTELTIGAGVASGTIEVVTNTDAVLEPHETLVLKLTAASTAGEVGVSTTAATAAATIEDKGTVTVSVRDAQASEGESVQFVVELTGAVSSEVKVSYATSDGTGANPAAGTDYTAVSATELTFRPGEALRQTVSVATAEDELNEADETFKLTMARIRRSPE